jgi:predicted amidohydrolase YtcJ
MLAGAEETMRRAVVMLVIGVGLAGCSRPPAADWVVTAARIYTLAGAPPARVEDEPVVGALAVRDGAIIATGDLAALRRFIGPRTRVEDLRDAVLLPGFVDCHVHLASLGRSLRQVDLVGTTSWDEIVARVAAAAGDVPAGTWITGRGWDQNDWARTEFPDHAALSAATPQHPVALTRIDGHATVVNAAALAVAGLDSRSADPAGGRIVRRADGSPSGVLVDAAMPLVTRHIPDPEPAERRARMRLALAHASRTGLTGVHDAGLGRADVEDLRALAQAGELPLRVYGMWDATADADDASAYDEALRVGPAAFDPSRRLALRCAKLQMDGALGSRGAALLEPYSDAPDQRGLPQYTLEAFIARARPLHAAGFQLATHAIGDAANRMVLDAYEQLQRETPRADARHRIEHAQVLSPADIPRFAVLGVLPSMQPTHCTSDMPWAGARLGPERVRGAYAWRSLRATGVVIPAGSDAPVERIAPLEGVYAAVTRQDAGGHPPGGYSPEERLTRSEALRAFTSWAVHAAFAETWCGTLEPGKRADLVVLDRDIVRCDAPDIRTARVLRTLVDGQDALPAAGAARTPEDSLRQRPARIPTH